MATPTRTRSAANAPLLLRLASTAGALIALAACAGARPPAEASRAKYSANERKSMIVCAALADATWNVAHAKQRGVPQEKVLASYESTDSGDGANVRTLMRKTVELVYTEEFDSPWDYAMGFYKDCALQLAKVPSDRGTLGSYCTQKALIATAAYDSKQAGMSRDDVVKRFRNFESDVPRAVIDRVYATSSPSRGDTLVDTWDACIDAD